MIEFFLYFDKVNRSKNWNYRNNFVIWKVWVESYENLWYQAANPQHITTNNGVEGLNQSFKKHFTDRTRQSFPSVFNLLKELVQTFCGFFPLNYTSNFFRNFQFLSSPLIFEANFWFLNVTSNYRREFKKNNFFFCCYFFLTSLQIMVQV